MDVNRIGQGSLAGNMSCGNEMSINNENSVRQVEKTEIINADYNKNKEEFTKKDLDKALIKLNKFLEDENVHAEYSVHDNFKNTIMIKIVNNTTKDVLMEVPPKKILDMIASMCRQFGLIDKKS